MKKIILILVVALLFTGCSLDKIDNTPTKKVENYFNNYQTLDKNVLDDLDLVIAKHPEYTNKQKEKYREILKKHYQNLTYKIKEETINGDSATVKVEIEVTDYSKILKESEEYVKNNKNEFLDKDNNYDKSKYIDYQLNQLENAKDKVKYTLNIKLNKNNDEWILENIDETTETKILGIFQY